MDSRVEELAQIINERASSAMAAVEARLQPPESKYWSYRRVQYMASQILDVIKEYRAEHPEEYD